MSGSGLGLSGDRGFARCPKCHQLVDASVDACRFCGARLDPEELKKAAAVQRKITETTARANNRRAFVAAVIGLIATIIGWVLWFLAKTWWQSRRYTRP